MSIFGFFYNVFKGSVLSSERDRIQDKFDHFDQRLDIVERDIAVIKGQLNANHQIGLANQAIALANNEATEQKLNAISATCQATDLIVKQHLAYMDDALSLIKEAIKNRA